MPKFEIYAINEKFKIVENQILFLNNSTEEEFLKIGAKLQSFLTEARLITQTASQTANSMSEDILNKGITELNLLLTEFSSYLSKSAATIKSDETQLLKILEYIHSIIDELSGFKRIVKHLRMLGISTKIESARLGNDDKGFTALADTVDKLSVMISEKASVINSKSESLVKVISKTAADLNNLEKVQLIQSNLILDNTADTLNAFNSKYVECSDKVNDVMRSFTDISRSISDVVTSIQFHDITRQQMEHVKEAVEEMMERSSNCTDADDDVTKEELGFIYDVCELQIAQVKNSNTEFNDAVLNIVNNLNSIENIIGGVLSKTEGLIDNRKGENKLSLQNIEKELNEILNGLVKNAEISEELSDSIKSVINIVEDLTKYIQQIEDIGTEIEIIALNARVKAAHTGTDGSALGVLSEAIQKLSIEAKTQTFNTSEILQRIGDISENLRKDEEEINQANNEYNLEATRSKISGLLTSISSMENNASSLLVALKDKVDKIKSEINQTSSNITVHRSMQTVSDVVLTELNSVLSSISTVPDIMNNKYHNTKELLKRYTMKSERDVHQTFSNEFEEFDVQIESYDSNTEESEFGDNVELF
ncbi:MAG: hypothetical protein KF721_04160 [Ignavibacteriaceae bacterium]|nr:hypothetical protein [Ignavibacteriaceae bacterium]